MSILRTKCDFDWTTPFGSVRTLPINCAKSNYETWPWKYWWTKTVESSPPIISTSELLDANASFYEEGQSVSGQVVLRCFFAYIATNTMQTSVTLNVSAEPPWDEDGGSYSLRENRSLTAKLYNASTGLVESYIDTDARNAEQTITLPATTCPKVLWLNASIQPTGIPPWQSYLPPCYAKITMSELV
jgi:hypothetical protein